MRRRSLTIPDPGARSRRGGGIATDFEPLSEEDSTRRAPGTRRDGASRRWHAASVHRRRPRRQQLRHGRAARNGQEPDDREHDRREHRGRPDGVVCQREGGGTRSRREAAAKVGLGDYTLELHSHKATRKEVAHELATSAHAPSPRSRGHVRRRVGDTCAPASRTIRASCRGQRDPRTARPDTAATYSGRISQLQGLPQVTAAESD